MTKENSIIEIMIDTLRKRKIVWYLDKYSVLTDDRGKIRSSVLTEFVAKKTKFLCPWYLKLLPRRPLPAGKTYYARYMKIYNYIDFCIEDGYIKYEYPEDFFIDITNKGNQLLNWDYFLVIVAEKLHPLKLFLAGLPVGAVIWLLIKWLINL